MELLCIEAKNIFMNYEGIQLSSCSNNAEFMGDLRRKYAWWCVNVNAVVVLSIVIILIGHFFRNVIKMRWNIWWNFAKTSKMFHLKTHHKNTSHHFSFKSTFPITGLSLHQSGGFGGHDSRNRLEVVPYHWKSYSGLHMYGGVCLKHRLKNINESLSISKYQIVNWIKRNNNMLSLQIVIKTVPSIRARYIYKRHPN